MLSIARFAFFCTSAIYFSFLTRYFQGLSVRPSVCLSVKGVECDKTKETCSHILIRHERLFMLVFDKKNGWWGRPFYLKCWAKLALLERKRRFPINILS